MERILSAARGLVADRGSRGLTIASVATRAGVSPASIYRHFEGGTAILRHLGQQRIAVIEERLAAASGGDPKDLGTLLGTLIEDLHATHRLDPSLREIFRGVLTEPALEDLIMHEAELILGVLRRAKPHGVRDGIAADRTDMLLLATFAISVTHAALDLPAIKAQHAISQAVSWLPALLGARA